jgi:hypothetical protein
VNDACGVAPPSNERERRPTAPGGEKPARCGGARRAVETGVDRRLGGAALSANAASASPPAPPAVNDPQAVGPFAASRVV